MPDILFPPDLVPNTMMFGIDDFTAVDESATTGGMQSSALYGTRRWHLRMDFSVISRKNGLLARFEALTASLRGRANRVWISPGASAKQRGSFPGAEMFANNDFSNGTSLWGSDANFFSQSAIDMGMRVTRTRSFNGASTLTQAVALSTGIGYCARFFINAGKGPEPQEIADFTNAIVLSAAPISQGMLESSYTAAAGGVSAFGLDSGLGIAGNYFDAKWASLTRCALVDNGVNLLINSDTPGTGGSWGLTDVTAATGSAVGPDGNTDAWSLTEAATTNAHRVFQFVTVPSSAADYTTSFFVKAANRSWAHVDISDGTNTITQFYNLSSGALGTSLVGANFALISAQCVDYGNGWKRCVLTYRKSSAATSIASLLGAAPADNTIIYLGTAASAALLTWRASLAQSSVPVQPIQTAATLQGGTLQTGYSLNLKALPVSTQGLLLEGDVVECLMPTNSQLLRVVSRLDSDAAGLGTLFFENALKQSPADGAGVIVQQPMGRFVLAAATLGIEYSPGVFGQASLEFVEAA